MCTDVRVSDAATELDRGDSGVAPAHPSLHLTFSLAGTGTALRDGCKLFVLVGFVGSMRDYVMQRDRVTFLSAERRAMCASANVL